MSREGYIDRRGNARARARRRAWVIETFDPDLDGQARCRLKLAAECLVIVDVDTLSVDRIELGGSYARGNIQPACLPCQSLQGWLTGASTVQGPQVAAYRDAHDAWQTRFEAATGRTWVPGLISQERRLSRRGGRRDVVDFVDADPPPRLSDWLAELSTLHARAGSTLCDDQQTG